MFDLWGGRRVVVALLAVGDQSMTWGQLANLVAPVFYKLADDEDPIRYGDNSYAFSAEIGNSTLTVLFHLEFGILTPTIKTLVAQETDIPAKSMSYFYPDLMLSQSSMEHAISEALASCERHGLTTTVTENDAIDVVDPEANLYLTMIPFEVNFPVATINPIWLHVYRNIRSDLTPLSGDRGMVGLAIARLPKRSHHPGRGTPL